VTEQDDLAAAFYDVPENREIKGKGRKRINADIKAALEHLDGTDAAAVSMMTDLSVEELDDLGGLPETKHDSEAH
jgi:hypothetical protein